MELGSVGIEGLGRSILCLNSEHPQELKGMPEGNSRCHGYGPSKQERPDAIEDEPYPGSKMPNLGLRSTENALPKQQMLSFSSSSTPEFSFLTDKDEGLIHGKIPQNVAFSYYHQSGFGSENLNGGMRGSFTPAQWIELEHQTMIYKYISANVSVPSNLLNPIRKAVTFSGFPSYFSLGSYPTHSYGLGPFHLGSNCTDPEPGRCRRTDGKKWRCSKDAAPDHKYCEKHIKKGRHRSRKPVESQTVKAIAGPACSKVVPPISPLPMSSSMVASSGCVSNSITTAQQQIKGLHNRVYDRKGLYMMHPTISSESKESPFSIPKHQIPIDESLHPEFGLVSNDSLLNPSVKPFHLSRKSYDSLSQYVAEKQAEDQGPPKPFMIDWPKDRSAVPWGAGEVSSDWTQLSMSIPVQSNFTSSSLSPSKDTMSLPPLGLSRDHGPSLMSLGLGTTVVDEIETKPNGWTPIGPGKLMGDPLGEALNNAMGGCKSNDEGSPRLGSLSSPTGVLQKAGFVSLSNNSSGGCSPRGENKITTTQEAVSLYDDLLCSAQRLIATSSSIPFG